MFSSLLALMALTCVIAVLVPARASADVTVRESIALTGLVNILNMHGDTTTTISGNKGRTDSNLSFESGLMRMLAHGAGQSTEIVRLDQDKVYTVNDRKKTYTETSLAEQRARLQQAMEKQQQAQQTQQQSASGVDESQCEWSEPQAEVIRNGEKAVIAGHQAERVIINATQACKNKETGQVCEFGLSFDSWLAPDLQASAEALAYQKAYAEKLGLAAASSRDFAERAQSMFSRYQGIWSKVADKMKNNKGYPVKSSFSLGVGGPQCQSGEQQQAQTRESSSPTGLGSALGALGGLFGRKKEETPAPAPTTPPPAAPNGLTPLMAITTELISIDQGAVPAAMFEAPAGYKKVAD
jgi:hypothetical protein